MVTFDWLGWRTTPLPEEEVDCVDQRRGLPPGATVGGAETRPFCERRPVQVS